ncbi:hypothetical protein BDQ17DRAFT_1287587 [Cyathus striatus]|nr:hypothetical protein BDQ17DRAFT_1287587 [Cyathus striatus]
MPPKPTKPTSRPKGKPAPKKGPKPSSPKAPLPPSEKLKRLFTSLCAQIDGGHFTNAIKTCDKILALSPGDEDATQTKLFLLLQTESYIPALSLLPNTTTFPFEKAYTLYRTHQEPESLAILSTLPPTRGKSHLEAQLFYRLGDFASAFDKYNDLLESADPGSEEHTDILTNLHAVQTQLEFITSSYTRGLLPSPPTEPPVLPSAPLPQQVVLLEKPKKKVRLPKGVVEGVTPLPDPERWLKKSERSSAAHGKRRKGGGGATQGSSVVEEKPVAVAVAGGKGKGRKKK